MARLLSFTCIVLLFSAWQAQEVTCNPVMAVVEAVGLAVELYQVIDELTQPILSADDQLTQQDLAVLDKLNTISGNVARVASRVEEVNENVYNKWNGKTAGFFKIINSVNRRFADFQGYTKHLKRISLKKLYNLVKDVKDPGFASMSDSVASLHDVLTDKEFEYQSLLDMLSSKKGTDLVCLRNQSPQQIIWELYNAVLATDLKALTLRLLATELLNKKQKKNSKTKNVLSQLELEKFNARIEKTYNEVVEHMSQASRELWKCDPPQNIKDHTYSKLQEVFQAIVHNEQDDNWNECSWSTCSQITDTRQRQWYKSHTDFSQKMPQKLKCQGQVTECKSTSAEIQFCPAPEEDDRRYLGMFTTQKYGDYNPNCRGHVWDTHVYSTWSNVCDFCLCTCATDKLNIDRYFSLEPAKSNVAKGMVITGVRLKKVNHVFYIEIQEGHLGENGTIDSVQWNTIPENKTVDFERIRREIGTNEWGDFPVNGEVYSVHWDQKVVFLDEIEIDKPDENLALTGLQFQQQGDALMLAIRMNSFDYATGQILDEGEWYFNDATEEERTVIPLDEADYPLKKERHVIDSRSDQFLEFQITNLKANMGQFTVPFLDIQPVVTNPPTILAGAAFYHKGARSGDSGGFLGLKLIQYDYSKHL